MTENCGEMFEGTIWNLSRLTMKTTKYFSHCLNRVSPKSESRVVPLWYPAKKIVWIRKMCHEKSSEHFLLWCSYEKWWPCNMFQNYSMINVIHLLLQRTHLVHTCIVLYSTSFILRKAGANLQRPSCFWRWI